MTIIMCPAIIFHIIMTEIMCPTIILHIIMAAIMRPAIILHVETHDYASLCNVNGR